jgi:UDPglucose 6-dehydrogenase
MPRKADLMIDDANLAVKARTRQLKITVLGVGHVGLPTALGLAELGWEVTGADDDSATVALLQASKSPFHEPGIQKLLLKHLKSGKFKPTMDIEGAIQSATVLFVCVGTPQRESGEADLTQVETIARAVARNLNDYKLIVEKSTVPAITAQWIKRTIERYARLDTSGRPGGAGTGASATSTSPFDVASNPEFLQEGKAVQDFFHPYRVVIGVESERARMILDEIYRPLNSPVLVTDLNTAELIKHAANAFLAAKISFINMVGDLCDAVGADVTEVAAGLGLDPRIGPHFLNAGIGFGGYCLPKDLRAFIYLAEELGVDSALLKEIERINQRRVDIFLKKVKQALWVMRSKTIAILGLAFKPGTDDIREAPALKIIQALLDEGANLQVYDPQAVENARRVFPPEVGRLRYCDSAYEAARGAHALLLVTEWEEFRQLDLVQLRDLMEVPVLVDGRNLYDPEELHVAGFEYVGMGRKQRELLQPITPSPGSVREAG